MRSDFVDRKGRPLVAVTGMGIVTSLGRGKEENWSKLVAGQSGIRHITRFPTEGLRTTIAGTVEGLEPAPTSRLPDVRCKWHRSQPKRRLTSPGFLGLTSQVLCSSPRLQQRLNGRTAGESMKSGMKRVIADTSGCPEWRGPETSVT